MFGYKLNVGLTVLGSYPQHEGDKLKVRSLFTRTMNQPL